MLVQPLRDILGLANVRFTSGFLIRKLIDSFLWGFRRRRRPEAVRWRRGRRPSGRHYNQDSCLYNGLYGVHGPLCVAHLFRQRRVLLIVDLGTSPSLHS